MIGKEMAADMVLQILEIIIGKYIDMHLLSHLVLPDNTMGHSFVIFFIFNA